MKKTLKFLPNIYIGLILLFLLIPIVSVIVFSFNEIESLSHWGGFSLRWYGELFNNRDVMEVIIDTVLIATVSTVTSTIIGTFAAISLTRQRRVFRETFRTINTIPIITPEIITAIALFVFFGAFAIQRGMATLLLAHIAFSTPYVIIAVYPKIVRLDPNILDAAYDLGATPVNALFKVILPQLKGSIFAGAAIAFTMSFDDFIISLFASGGTVRNISIYLYTLRRGIPPTMNALSTFIVLAIGVKVVIDYIKGRRTTNKEED